ncbi:aspartate aminotransferase, partial [Arthrospira sp. O9.13F]
MNLDYSRMQSVQSPIIPIIGKLINNHPGTISLGQGVVYYGPPPVAFDHISEFLASPENHKYKPVIGITPLLEIIADKLQTENHINLSDRQKIVVTAGSNMGFMNAILAITSPGDEIIIQSPYYFNHEMAIMMASCQPVVIQTDDNYQLRIDAIQAAITDKTRAIVTISPNNPTGAVYSPEALQEINQICSDRHLYHISDEAYEYFTYNKIKHTSPATFP